MAFSTAGYPEDKELTAQIEQEKLDQVNRKTMAFNPMSPYATVELRMSFHVRKGQGSVISCGSLGVEDHAKITDALNRAIEMHLPEGFVFMGSKLEIGDL